MEFAKALESSVANDPDFDDFKPLRTSPVPRGKGATMPPDVRGVERPRGGNESSSSDHVTRTAWLKLFRDTRSKDRSPKPVAGRVPQFAKYTLKLKHYDGTRGKAHRWWKDTRQTIFSVTPNPSPLEINAFLNLIIDALDGYDKGIKMINQIKPKCMNDQGGVDLDALMAIFVEKHDEHSLDIVDALK